MTVWMLAALGVGTVCGLLAPELSRELGPLANVFIRLIRSIVAPLLFGVLVSAVASATDLRGMGRLGIRSVVCFEVVTTFALLIGWGAVAVARPGEGVRLVTAEPRALTAPSFTDVVERSFPASVMDAMARGDYTAPVGVFAAMASAIGGNGSGVLMGLGRFVAAAWCAQLAFVLLVVGSALRLARVPLASFARAAWEPVLVAFGTTSSAAALPAAMAAMETFGASRRVIGFAMPLSLSLNAAGQHDPPCNGREWDIYFTQVAPTCCGQRLLPARKHLTMALYGTGSTATACCTSR